MKAYLHVASHRGMLPAGAIPLGFSILIGNDRGYTQVVIPGGGIGHSEEDVREFAKTNAPHVVYEMVDYREEETNLR